jgi:basic amino acid/polyamine antiporter, APA family
MNSERRPMAEEKEKDERGLKRRMGVFSVFAICTGAAFSSGFFLLPGMAANMSGPSLPLAYLAAGILMLPAILSISELSAAMPRSGGPYFFVTRSFGPLLGMIGALGKFIQLLLKGAFAFVGVGIYLSVLLEVPTTLVAIILIVLFTFINLLGVRQTATTEKVLVIILILLLTYFIVAGINQVYDSSNDLQDQFLPMMPMGWSGFFSTVAFVFISFGGVAQVASVAEEVKKPARSFPKGILLSLAVSTFFYLAGTVIMISLISSEALHGDQTPVVTAARQITSLPLPVHLVVIAALAAFASTGNAAILSASRYPLALARDKLLWSKFGKVSSKGIPRQAVLLSGALSIALTILFNVQELAKIASAFLLFVFLTMCLAVIIFRESHKRDYDPKFKSPLYPWTQITGCLIYLWLIWENGLQAIGFIALIFLLGLIWYLFGIKEKPQFSAAVFSVMKRIVLREEGGNEARNIAISFDDSDLPTIVEDADFVDLEKEISFDEAVDKAAETLAHRLGGKRENLVKVLQNEADHWKGPNRLNISVAPILLEGIEQPHMVLIRGTIKMAEGEINGLVVIADDTSSANRLLKLTGQLEIAILHEDFPEKWQQASKPSEIKNALLKDLRSFSIGVKSQGPTSYLKGKKLIDLELPEQAVPGAVYRNGKLLSEKDIILEEGDEIIVISQGKAHQQLQKKFSSESSKF